MKKYLIASLILMSAGVALVSAQSFNFQNNLTVGMGGTDVVNLQSYLIAHGYSIPAITSGVAAKGYFGSQTRLAVQKYQNDNGVPSTGFVGPLTRRVLNSGTVVTGTAPVINGFDAPSRLSINETGTWTVHASDPMGAQLSYWVTWGDEALYLPVGLASSPTAYPPQTSSFTHSYAAAGSYTVRVTVRNTSGITAETSSTVTVASANSAGPLNIISPNGGENWTLGTTQTIRWTSPYYFRATYADIRLFPYQTPCSPGYVCPAISAAIYTIASGISINQNSYSWRVGDVISPAPGTSQSQIAAQGQYKLQVCETGTNNCDSSDGIFTISSSSVIPPAQVTVISPNGNETWNRGTTQTIRWSGAEPSNNMKITLEYQCPNTYCTLIYRPPYTISPQAANTGSFAWNVGSATFEDGSSTTVPNGTYIVRVCKIEEPQQATGCDVSNAYFTLASQ